MLVWLILNNDKTVDENTLIIYWEIKKMPPILIELVASFDVNQRYSILKSFIVSSELCRLFSTVVWYPSKIVYITILSGSYIIDWKIGAFLDNLSVYTISILQSKLINGNEKRKKQPEMVAFFGADERNRTPTVSH